MSRKTKLRRKPAEADEVLKSRLRRAQQLVRARIPAGTSLVDELIAERREAAKAELAEGNLTPSITDPGSHQIE